jgi:hypothetical protein
MLRDDRQIALGGAIEACLHAAHVHEDGADLISERTTVLRQLGARRREDAEILAEHLRRLGDLPKEPDPEYQAAADLVSHLKAAIVEDERAEVLARSQQAENALMEALQHLLELELAPECREDVDRILGSRATLV